MTQLSAPDHIPTVTLGRGLTVTAQGYGAMSLTDAYGPISDEDALVTLRHALNSGITFIDTANLYGYGRSESLIGQVLPSVRDQVQIATKFGIVRGDGPGGRGINGRPEHVHEQIDLSLQRLGTDHVDLYYQHRPDPQVPIEETVGAMGELVAAGKVLHLGLSEATGAEIRRAHAEFPITAVQSEWSVFSRDVEESVIPACVELGIGFVPYSPVSRGLLTGTFSPDDIGETDTRHIFPRFDSEALPHNLEVVARFNELAAQTEGSPAQVAIAWLHAKAAALGLDISPIPGTRFTDRVTENLGALSLSLSDDVVSALDALAQDIIGARSRDPRWTSLARE